MKSRYAVLAALLALPIVGCDEPPLPTSPTIYVGGNTQVVNIGTQEPSPSPSPGSSCTAGAVDSVRVNPFGTSWDCPNKPANNAGILPVGCRAPVTATPKDRAGNDVPAAIHGPVIAWSLVFGGSAVKVDDDPLQPFNKHVTGLTAGDFRLEATVCGVTGAWNGRVVP